MIRVASVYCEHWGETNLLLESKIAGGAGGGGVNPHTQTETRDKIIRVEMGMGLILR